MKSDLPWKERKCSTGCKFFPLTLDPFLDGTDVLKAKLEVTNNCLP